MTPVPVVLGERLRSALAARGWSIRSFAKAADISRPALQNYLAGRRCPSAARLVQIARALDTDVATLLPGHETKQVA